MLYIVLAVLCLALSFTLNKVYQLKFCKGITDLLLFPIVSSLVGWILYFIFNRFQIHFAWVTFTYALLYAITTTFNNIVGLVIMKHCKMSLYMSFLMIGGMFIPFLYGVIFLNEALTWMRGIALVLLIAALILPAFEKSQEKTSLKGLLLCCSVFASNGLVSTFSKIHQVNENALGTYDFMLWVNLFSLVFVLIIFAIFHILQKKKKPETLPSAEGEKTKNTLLYGILLLTLISIICAAGALFNLTGAKTVDAAMLYPMITGGTIILTSIAGWTIYKEKINKFSLIGVLIALVGTILFAF